MTEKIPHVLFLGGKPRNIPEKNLRLTWEQIDQDEADRKQAGMKKLPSAVLVFKDFLSHAAYFRWKEKAEMLHIPYIVASGGFGALIQAAKAQGVDLTPWVHMNGNGNGVKPVEEAPAPPRPPTVADVAEDVKLWLSRVPPTAIEMEVSKGRKILVVRVKNKRISVVMKGLPLELALTEIRRRGMDKTRLTKTQGDMIARYLDDELGLHERQLHLEGSSIARVSNFLHGFLTEKERREVIDPRGVLKERRERSLRKKAKPTKPSAPAQPPGQPATPVAPAEPPAPAPVKPVDIPAPKDPRSEAFLAHLAHVDEMERKLVTLYDRILSLTAENASFVEQIEKLEGLLKTKEEELRKWKELATK